MSNVVNIKNLMSVSDGLRAIADDFDEGLYGDESCTLILGNNLFHLGTLNDTQAVKNSVFDMTYGINFLMKAVK